MGLGLGSGPRLYTFWYINQKKKKFLRLKKFWNFLKNFFFIFLIFFKTQHIFFLIYIPKCIKLNYESGSRWVLGLMSAFNTLQNKQIQKLNSTKIANKLNATHHVASETDTTWPSSRACHSCSYTAPCTSWDPNSGTQTPGTAYCRRE